jgi:hypothetical protein
MMAGQFAKARESADLLVANVLQRRADGDDRAVRREEALRAPRFARWDDVMKLPAPNPTARAADDAVAFRPRRRAGGARQRRGRGTRARGVRAAQTRVSPDFDWGYNKARNMFAVSDAVLDAGSRAPGATTRRDRRLADARSSREGRAQLQRAGRLVLPDARVARRGAAAGEEYGQAEDVFRQDLTEESGRNGRSLFGLWQSLLLQKKESAKTAEKDFRSAWKNADVQLDLRHY